MSILWMLAGLLLLLVGAELLVRGGTGLASSFGVSRLVIGLTVVAFGTSCPELAVSLGAGLQGRAELAAGNVVGSNIFNILVILGLSAIVTPLAANLQVIRWEVPILIGCSLLPSALAWDGVLSRSEGFVLVGFGVGYVLWQLRQARATSPADGPDPEDEARVLSRGEAAAFVLLGLLLLMAGARFFVDGASDLARALGLSELVIGLTVVAAGTSLPEVAASVAAALRGERDMAVGNVLGSNIFNILFVLGASATVSSNRTALPESLLTFDLPIMVVLSILCLPLFFTDMSVTRWEGLGLLAAYGGYTCLQVLAATGSPHLPAAHSVLMVVAGIAVLVVLFQAVRQLIRTERASSD